MMELIMEIELIFRFEISTFDEGKTAELVMLCTLQANFDTRSTNILQEFRNADRRHSICQ